MSRDSFFNLQSTLTLTRLDTVGGTPLLAIHKYAPMSSLEILAISNTSPSHSDTENQNFNKKA